MNTTIASINDSIGRLTIRQVELESEIATLTPGGSGLYHPEQWGHEHQVLKGKEAELVSVQLQIDELRRDLMKAYGALRDHCNAKLNGTLIVSERQLTHTMLTEVEAQIEKQMKILNR